MEPYNSAFIFFEEHLTTANLGMSRGKLHFAIDHSIVLNL